MARIRTRGAGRPDESCRVLREERPSVLTGISPQYRGETLFFVPTGGQRDLDDLFRAQAERGILSVGTGVDEVPGSLEHDLDKAGLEFRGDLVFLE